MLAASESEWGAALDRHRPRFAVIYEDNFNYLSKMCLLRMRQAALTMIDAARARGITTIVAGADATDHPAAYLERGADVVVAGEGEVTLVELLDTLSGANLSRLRSTEEDPSFGEARRSAEGAKAAGERNGTPGGSRPAESLALRSQAADRAARSASLSGERALKSVDGLWIR